jgi:hypothetical protein
MTTVGSQDTRPAVGSIREIVAVVDCELPGRKITRAASVVARLLATTRR